MFLWFLFQSRVAKRFFFIQYLDFQLKNVQITYLVTIPTILGIKVSIGLFSTYL